MRPRILIVENAIDVTGSLKAIINSCTAVGDQYQFHFLLPSGSKAQAHVARAGFTSETMPFGEIQKSLSLLWYVPTLISNTRRFHSLVRSLRPQLVIVNDFYNMVVPLYRRSGGATPYVTFVRFMPSRFPKLLLSWWCRMHSRWAESVVAVSNAVARELPIDKQKVIVNYDFLAKSTPFDDGRNAGQEILYVSNYIKGKGQDYALSAFASIAEKFPAWRLKFIGGDMGLTKNKQFRKQLEETAVKSGLGDRVIFQGFEDDVASAYQRAAIVLNFSDSESFSMTCLEAMGAGRPVVATRSGGPAELIEDGVSGLLVKVGDVSQMSAAMERLLASEELRIQIGKRAQGRAHNMFGADRSVAGLLGIIQRAMASSPVTAEP